MANADIATIVEVLHREIPVLTNVGTISSVRGSTAYVIPNGSSSVIPCRIASNIQNAQQGDSCIIMKAVRETQWIVTATFTPSSAGFPDSSPGVAAHSAGAARFGNMTQYQGPSGNVNCNSLAYIDTGISLTHRVKSDTVLVGVNARSWFTASATADIELHLTIAVDGTDMSYDNSTPVPMQVVLGRTTTTWAPAVFTYPIKGLSPGNHNFTILAKQNSLGTSAIHRLTVQSFYIMDN